MRRLSTSIASIGFFGLAIVGWFSGVPLLLCGLRAVAGAAVIYVLTNFVGNMAFRIIVQAAVRPEPEKDETSDGKDQQ